MFEQQMGDLPAHRISPARPFLYTGVDFFGPVMTHYRIRGKRPTKSYVAVFCCFVTKAIHMEVVSDLTAEGFLEHFEDLSVEEECAKIYILTTNFVGAKNILQKAKKDDQDIQDEKDNEEILLNLERNQDLIFRKCQDKEIEFHFLSQEQIVQDCQDKGILFHFSPPRSPHFQGLCEAAVKSAKKLLKRAMLSALTYEELSTVITEAEAVLNSRPLSSMSSDPNDLTPLTPGHFLIGEPLSAIPDVNTKHKNLSNLTRWKLVSAMRKDFWRRWTEEYLHELQTRSNWTEVNENIDPGMLVLVKEDNQTPLKWPVGRIESIKQGEDKLVRVAIVKTANGRYERAITNLAPLPIQGENSSNNSRKRNDSEVEANSTSTRKCFRFSYNASTLFLVTLFFLPLLIFGHQPFKVDPLQSSVGVYINKMGSGNLVKTHWNMIVYYNMSGYWQGLKRLNDGISKLSLLAYTSNDNRYLELINSEYHHQLQEIEEVNQLLFNNSAHLTRRKRGLINGVGNLANVLFGVLDDDEAKRIDHAINNVKSDQKYLLTLMKNQTSVIEATNKLIKKTHEGYMENFVKVHKELAEVVEHLNDENVQIQRQKITLTLALFSQCVQLTLSEFKKTQDHLVKVMTDIHHGQTNPLILSPKQFAGHLDEIKAVLPSDLSLPNYME